MDMHVNIMPILNKAGYFTVEPHGPIDSDNYLDFRDKISPLLTKTTKSVILDLADVDYISSAGLGVLFTMKKHLMGQNGDLVFCHLKPQIRRLFEIVNALPQETMFKSVEEADAYLYKMMNREIDKNLEKNKRLE